MPEAGEAEDGCTVAQIVSRDGEQLNVRHIDDMQTCSVQLAHVSDAGFEPTELAQLERVLSTAQINMSLSSVLHMLHAKERAN